MTVLTHHSIVKVSKRDNVNPLLHKYGYLRGNEQEPGPGHQGLRAA